MKTRSWTVKIFAALCFLCASFSLPAHALDFSFTISGAQGTATGIIEGLSDNSTSVPSAVYIESYSSQPDFSFSVPVLLTEILGNPFGPPDNNFTVQNGAITAYDYYGATFTDGVTEVALELDSFDLAVYQQGGKAGCSGVCAYINSDDTVTFAPISPTPLPAALPLFAAGLGALGLLGWRRKRAVRSVAA
jgi:hypothetical protein